MKTNSLLVLTAAFALLTSAAFVRAQVNPPPTTLPGDRTMKTLQQIEPRTAIASLPFTINQPGAYYLEKNLTGAASQTGLTISSDNVTLDLNGFELRGVTNSNSGIFLSGTRYNVVIRNGSIHGWGNHGINGTSGRHTTVLDVRSSGNKYDGINVGDGSTVRDCVVFANQRDGVEVGQRSSVVNCLSASNGWVGIRATLGTTIHGCMVTTNLDEGILVSDYCRVIGNMSDGNNYGIRATGAGNRIEDNHTARSVTKGYKVDLQYGENVIVKNSARNTLDRVSDYNYQVASGNFFGPVIESWGSGQLRNSYPENHPWANFGDPVTIY